MKISGPLYVIVVGLLVVGYADFAAAAERVSAQTSMPSQLIAADRAYKHEGPEAFVTALLKGSYPLGTGDDMSKIKQSVAVARLLEQVQVHYGQYRGAELIAVLPIASSTRVVYYVLNYEHGPAFGILSLYESGGAELITGYAVNTELHKIVPLPLLADRMWFPQSED